MPDASVIVPARNSAATLALTLAALARQEFAGEYEVIVVDDGSSDETPTVAEATGARVIRRASNGGAARARNLGAAAASAAVLAFTDADCEPAPDWLAQGVRALDRADLVQGAVLPDPKATVGPYDRTLRVTEESGLWESANLFVRRDLFERLGGFPSFLAGGEGEARDRPRGTAPRLGEAPMGEDTWFGWRARRSGARATFSAEAIVYHAVFERDWRGYLAERRRARYFPALVSAVPELRSRLFMRYFMTQRTAALTLATVALTSALSTRRPVLLLGAAPYIAIARPRRLDRWSLEWAVREVPADAIRAASLLRGSVEARTLLL